MPRVRSAPAGPRVASPGVITRSFWAGGQLEVRVTRDASDVAAAQALRYQVFYREMAAQPSAAMASAGRDFDAFDAVCDHVLVIDHARAPGDAVVGTYRLLRHDVAERYHGFYSAGEYDLSVLHERAARAGGLLEIGRGCVHPDYRSSLTIMRLWRGIAGYIAKHGVAYLFGCASLPGTEPSVLGAELAYLHDEHLAPPELRVRAWPKRYVDMSTAAPGNLSPSEIVRSLPPLIKGYLRLGAYVGDGAVVDEQFGTTDVFVLLPLERVAERYFTHFDRPG